MYTRDAWLAQGRSFERDLERGTASPIEPFLLRAEECARQGIEVDPDSADPLAALLPIQRGLGESAERAYETFLAVHQRSPFRPDACWDYLHVLRPTWGGTREAMLGFARWVNEQAPADSAARVTLPFAHWEAALERQNGQPPEAYLVEPRVRDELVHGLEVVLAATPPRGRSIDLSTLNHYLLAVVPSDHHGISLYTEAVTRVDDRPTSRPWAQIGSDIEATFQAVVRRRKLAGQPYLDQ